MKTIYIFIDQEEVKESVEKCGFKIIVKQYDMAYEPKDNDTVPENAAGFQKIMNTEKYLNYLSSIDR